MALNLQIPFTAPATTLAGFNALASGMGEFLKQQQEKQKEIADLQSQKNKADIILKHFAGSNRPDGTPYITPQELLDYQNAPLKKQVDIAQGLAANVAFDTAQRNQALQQGSNRIQDAARVAAMNHTLATTKNLLSGQTVTAVPLPGGGSVPVMSGGGMTPQIVHVPGPAPEKAGTKETLPNGQTVIYDQKGTPHFSAPDPKAPADNFKKLNDEIEAASGANFFEWTNATNPKVNKDGSIQAEIPDSKGKPRIIKLTADQQAAFAGRFKTLSGGGLFGGAASAPASRVKVIDGQGKMFTIPAEQLEQAVNQGYKAVP